ncbi:hypothetical protein [Pantoea sp. BAV 3049]|uniref:hypothetical protein n=1 Tax=Pantoea sp. BAV 3049 TaxID=2654188 RepID=UPI00131BAB69|nr:hypothetical protein [Pantoea sp. BAV 3049]
MKYKVFSLAGLALIVLASWLVLPGALQRINHSEAVDRYVASPDSTFAVFTGCKKQVDDANDCYNAYSAAVALSESQDCGVARRFKTLVEHNRPEIIEQELAKVCTPEK